METKISRSAPELELQRAVHCLKYAETSTLQLKNVYSFVLKLNDGLKSAIMGLRSTIRNLRKVEQERDYWKLRFEALQNREENGNNWRLRYETLLTRNVQLEEELRKIYSNEMAIEQFHPNSRMDVASPFFTPSSTTSNGTTGGGGSGSNLVLSQPAISQRRVNAIINGNNHGANGNGDLNDADEDDDESDFEDDSEGAGVGGFLPMIEGPVVSNVLTESSSFNPTNFLKIKCEVQDEDDDEEEEDNEDDLEENEGEIKMNGYESNSNPMDNNSSSQNSNSAFNGLHSLTNINLNNMIKNDIDVDVVANMIDYEALRNCLAKDARQCPVCPRICSQRNSTVRHLIEVHHLDRSELMIRKFHKGYHFANFSK